MVNTSDAYRTMASASVKLQCVAIIMNAPPPSRAATMADALDFWVRIMMNTLDM